MKKVLAAMAVSSLLLAGTSCLAAEGMYVKGSVKYVMPGDPEIEFLNVASDNGYGFGGAIGMAMNMFRIEAEIATQKTDVDALGAVWDNTGVPVESGDVRMTTYMVNGYLDIPVSGGFGLYGTGGLGYGTTTLSVYNVDGDDSGFAWKVGAGAFFEINPNLALDVGWEYVTMDDADMDVDVTDLYSNNVVASFRYTF